MATLLKLLILSIHSLLLVFCATDNWLGPGKWSVTSTEDCASPERYPFKFDLTRKRINRTHEGVAANFLFPDALDDSIGVKIVVCTYVDGGCKPYRVITHNCFREFCDKFAAENVREIFRLSGIDPPDFPVKAGEYKMEEYLFNYDELPESAAYGAYRAEFSLTKNMMPVSCHVIMAEFNELGE